MCKRHDEKPEVYSKKSTSSSVTQQHTTYKYKYHLRESVDSLRGDGANTPINLYKQNPSKLPNAEILSLYRHLALILERFCTQQYSQNS